MSHSGMDGFVRYYIIILNNDNIIAPAGSQSAAAQRGLPDAGAVGKS